jgi:hypothetical protein
MFRFGTYRATRCDKAILVLAIVFNCALLVSILYQVLCFSLWGKIKHFSSKQEKCGMSMFTEGGRLKGEPNQPLAS